MFSDRIDNVDIFNKGEYKRLTKRIRNQRKVIKAQSAKIDNLIQLINYYYSESHLTAGENKKIKIAMADLHDKLNAVVNRYYVVTDKNDEHLKKLIALQHVMDRGASSIAFR